MNKKQYKHQWYIQHRQLTINRAGEWRKEHPDARKRIVAKNNKKSAIRKRIWHEQKVFDSAISLIGKVCEKCGSDYRIGIHHKDGNNGKRGKPMNNDPKNLIILCVKCHSAVHGWWGIKEI